MNKIIMITFAIVLAATTSQAFDKEIENLAGEWAECAAFYTMMENAMIKSGQTEFAVQLGNAGDMAVYSSFMLASITRNEEIAASVTKSRIVLYIYGMIREISDNNANISILRIKHMTRCRDMIENPPEDALIERLTKGDIL